MNCPVCKSERFAQVCKNNYRCADCGERLAREDGEMKSAYRRIRGV